MRTFLANAACGALLFAADVTPAAEPDVWMLSGTRLYTRPDAAPIENGVLLVRKDKIVALGSRDSLKLRTDPPPQSSCSGGVIVAGFYNHHVHFSGTEWADAAKQPAEALSSKMSTMLSRYGFTSVVDAGSNPRDTVSLRARVRSGEVLGPHIFTAGIPLYPPEGLPFYLSSLPAEIRALLPQPASEQQAIAALRLNFEAGADAVKLFVATPQGDGTVKRMPANVASAAAAAAHERGKLVLAHPTDIEGVEAAVTAGVDVVMHTTIGDERPWPQALIDRMVKRRVALVPTLQLVPYEIGRDKTPPAVAQRIVNAAVAPVRQFNAAGGDVLFGTDVGYMADFDSAEEYELMAQAGLSSMQILAALTTRPAARWQTRERGYLAEGMDADIVVLDADPANEVRNFAKVRCTFRAGVSVYQR